MRSNARCNLCGSPAFELAFTQECENPTCKNYSREFAQARDVQQLNPCAEIDVFDNPPYRDMDLFGMSVASNVSGYFDRRTAQEIQKMDPMVGDYVAHRNSPSILIGCVISIEQDSDGFLCGMVQYDVSVEDPIGIYNSGLVKIPLDQLIVVDLPKYNPEELS